MMKYPKLRELKEAIRSFVSRPITTSFPFKPHEPPESYRGKMEWRPDVCVACGACAMVCPADAIEVTEDLEASPPMRKLVRRYDVCIFCSMCNVDCTTETGCVSTKEYDMAVFSREACTEDVEKELVLCGGCGVALTTRDHLRFLHEKLGPLAFSNPTLTLLAHRELAIVREGSSPEGAADNRKDRMRVLCPKCRRDMVLTD